MIFEAQLKRKKSLQDYWEGFSRNIINSIYSRAIIAKIL